MEIEPWELYIRGTALHVFVRTYEPWLWPLCETLHYLGLSILLGTIGLFALRVLGMAKGITFAALHRLIHFGLGGYMGTILTRLALFFCPPPTYFFNNPFPFHSI